MNPLWVVYTTDWTGELCYHAIFRTQEEAERHLSAKQRSARTAWYRLARVYVD